MSRCELIPALVLGSGAIDALVGQVQRHRVSRPLLISDRGLVRAGHLNTVRALLQMQFPVACFLDVPENPTFAGVDAGADVYRANNCDAVVALGGGSVLDTAKLVAVLAGHPGRAADFVGFSDKVTSATAPIFAIPTTAGTGSEASPDAGIHPDSVSRSSGITSPHVVPRVAICDPDLTATLPKSLTAATGLDALTHCIEGYLAEGDAPVADAMALDGIARIAENIGAATESSDPQSRAHLMWAAFAGGVAIGKGLGPAHAIAISCGDRGIHHGILSALGLLAIGDPLERTIPDRCAAVRKAMGIAEKSTLSEHLRALIHRLGLPTSLGAAGYVIRDLDELAASCAVSHFNATSRLKLTSHSFRRRIETIA